MCFYEMNNGLGELHGATISGKTSEPTLFKQTVSLLKNDELIQKTQIQTNGTFTFPDIEESGLYKIQAISTGNISTEISLNISGDNIVEKDVISVNLPLNYVTIIGTTSENSLFGKIVNLYQDEMLIDTAPISDEGNFTFIITNSGTYTLKATDGTDEATEEITISQSNLENKLSFQVDMSFLKIVTFQNGSIEEISKMLDAHYAGKINIEDYWSSGDRRLIHINSMSATGVSESHHADDYYFVIYELNHDILTNPIGVRSKAALTLGIERILFKDTKTTSYSFGWNTSEECGYMNSSNTNVGGWKDCARRTWCNNTFINSLPTLIQALCKYVNKYTSAGESSSNIITTSDRAFLLSEIEIFGTTKYSYAGEGSQYQYFKTTSNRYKLPAYSGYSSASWWERSPCTGYSAGFCSVINDGAAHGNSASDCYGLAPAICF